MHVKIENNKQMLKNRLISKSYNNVCQFTFLTFSDFLYRKNKRISILPQVILKGFKRKGFLSKKILVHIVFEISDQRYFLNNHF